MGNTVQSSGSTLVVQGTTAALSLSTVAPRTVFSFLDSLGVGAHIDSGNAQWTNAPVLLGALQYLGIRNVRDGTPFDYALPTFITLARAGIRFNLMEANVYSFDQTGMVNATLDVSRARALELAVPGSIISFEGTNEYTTNSYYLDGRASNGDLLWGLADAAGLQIVVRADTLFINTPILAPSAIQLDSLPNFGAFVDAANAHVYGNVGEQLQDRIINSIRFAQASAPGEPVYITEVGISSSGYGTSNWGVTDEDTQALINVNALLSGYAAGAAKTFIYELMDEPNASNVQEQHFGLFHPDGTPKLAATAIHNLTQVLADDGAGGVTPASLEYLLSGLPSTASALLLQDSYGVYDLILWDGRATLYDGVREVSPAASTVTLTLGSAASIEVYNPILSASAQALHANATSLNVQLSAAPIIIEFRLAGGPVGTPLAPPATLNVLAGGSGTATIYGSAHPGSTVSVFDGSTVLGTATADATGHWSLGLPSSTASQRALTLTEVTLADQTIESSGITLFGKTKQVLQGGSGDDVLIGAAGDRLIGGAGSDKFVINSAPGKQVIVDFDQGSSGGVDRIYIDDQLAANFDSLMGLARQSGSNVVISFAKSDVLTLQNVSLSSLDAGDFLFF